MTPFDWLNCINNKTEPTEDASSYNPFIVNRGLSYFKDSLFFVNEMNQRWQLDNDIQFTFLNTTINRRKRFAKWEKPLDDADVEIIMAYYSISRQRAEEYKKLLSTDQLDTIKENMSKGGRR